MDYFLWQKIGDYWHKKPVSQEEYESRYANLGEHRKWGHDYQAIWNGEHVEQVRK